MFFLKLQSTFPQFQTITVSECCSIQLRPCILVDTYININILALEMASPGNRHCANCIGTLSFPMSRLASAVLVLLVFLLGDCGSTAANG